MNSFNLKILADVARYGSFASAARAHGLDPSSVSRIVAIVESELGIRLFQRSTRQLSLTEAGTVYLQRIEAILDELERAREDALSLRRKPQGTLRLTASVAFGQRCLVPLLSAFRTAYPDFKLELLFTDDNLDLIGERIDLAIRLGPGARGDLISTKLRDTHYHVCASPAYIAAARPIAEPGDISHHACVLSTLHEFRSPWLFRNETGQVEEVPVMGDILISTPLALREAAIAGLGPALLADWLIDKDVDEGRLVDLFPNYRVAATSFDSAAWLLYPSRAFLPNKVRVMIDFLRQRLKKLSITDGT